MVLEEKDVRFETVEVCEERVLLVSDRVQVKRHRALEWPRQAVFTLAFESA